MFKIIFGFYLLVMFEILLNAEGTLFNINVLHSQTDDDKIKSSGYGFDDFAKPKPKPHNTTNFTLALRKYLDNEFYGTIGVGSRGQEFQVIFDTAWSTSWIMSKDCPPSVIGCKDHHLYDHDRSATYVRNGTKFSSNEGEYTLSGYYSKDKIKYGGATINQTFVEMTVVPSSYNKDVADGVIGLSPSYGGEKTLPEMLYEKGMIKEPKFCIYINRDFQSDRGGDIMLGAINKKHIHVTNKVQDAVTYVNVDDSRGTWAFNMDGVAMIMNNKSIPLCIHGCSAFIDTGTVYIFAPKAAVSEINYRIHATDADDGKFAIDCDKIRKLPPINFIIGGKAFSLKGIDYVRKVTIRNQMTCYSVFKVGSSETEWILGASFLARYFSIYDFATKVIGFVRAA